MGLFTDWLFVAVVYKAFAARKFGLILDKVYKVWKMFTNGKADFL